MEKMTVHMCMNRIARKLVHDVVVNLFPTKGIKPMMRFIKDNHNNDLIGLEVGVKLGFNSFSIMRHLDIKKLYLIDPYVDYLDQFGVIMNYSDCEKIAHVRLKRFDDKIVWIKDFSYNVYDSFPNNFFDFCYVDGSMNSDCVRNDIINFYRKLKFGGVLGGNNFNAGWEAVPVILDLFDNPDLFGDDKSGNWWIVKKNIKLNKEKDRNG